MPKSVKTVTSICFVIGLLFLIWYALSDRITPYTNQAIVNGFVIPIVPEISGTVSQIKVQQNQTVQAGDVLAIIDSTRYELAVQKARIDLEAAGQAIGSDTATVATKQAAVLEARAGLSNAEKDLQRLGPLFRENLVAQAEYDAADTKLKQAQAGYEKAEAELERAKSLLGKQGEENTKIKTALNALAKAEVDLQDTILTAPSQGGVTNVQIGAGHYAKAGSPLMTFVSSEMVWLEARMRENNLGRLKKGTRADITLDIAPGRVFRGEVFSVGYGVSNNLSNNLGGLPNIRQANGWFRDPQRFPVLIKFSDDKAYGLRRVGGQASVTVYTGSNPILNFIAKLRIRFSSLISYLF